MITIEQVEIKTDYSLGSRILEFICSVDLDMIWDDIDPLNDEYMLIIAREIAIQVKVLKALTQEY